MKISLVENEIKEAVKYYVKNYYGLNLEVSNIDLAATRGNDGITANIELCLKQLGTDNCNSSNDTLPTREPTSNKEPEPESEAPEPVPESVSDTPTGNENESNNGNDTESSEGPVEGHAASSSSRSLFASLTQ